MAHEHRSGLYVPVYYVLTTDRTEQTYMDVLHSVARSTNMKLRPSDVACDFEQGLINAVGTQFPEADVIGCLFHFKQAVRRRMKSIGIPTLQASIAMRSGFLDMLTVIDRAKILSHGICWVIANIRRECRKLKISYSREKWGAFWVYFYRTWMVRFEPDLWNVYGIAEYVITRTNNPLERFNRELNSAMGPHPSLPVFVATISKISARFAQRLQDVRKKRSKKKARETIEFKIPTAVEFGDEPIDSEEEYSASDGWDRDADEGERSDDSAGDASDGWDRDAYEAERSDDSAGDADGSNEEDRDCERSSENAGDDSHSRTGRDTDLSCMSSNASHDFTGGRDDYSSDSEGSY